MGWVPISDKRGTYAVFLVSLLLSCQAPLEQVAEETAALGTKSGPAGRYSVDPNTWKVVARPDRDDWWEYGAFDQRAMLSDYEWIVESVDGRAVARLLEDGPAETGPSPDFDTTVELRYRKAAAFRTVRVNDGWIAAYEAVDGDGSAVYWFNENGEQKVKLSAHQINGFLIEGDRVIAVEGLAHNRTSDGSIIEIQKVQGHWAVTELFLLHEVAQAIGRIAEDDYIVATANMLLRVNLRRREMSILIPHAGWGGWIGEANSVVVDKKFVYVGMRQFVARCKLGKSVQDFEFLVPGPEWLAKAPEGRDSIFWSETSSPE